MRIKTNLFERQEHKLYQALNAKIELDNALRNHNLDIEYENPQLLISE
jgi:hypothetical protein